MHRKERNILAHLSSFVTPTLRRMQFNAAFASAPATSAHTWDISGKSSFVWDTEKWRWCSWWAVWQRSIAKLHSVVSLNTSQSFGGNLRFLKIQLHQLVQGNRGAKNFNLKCTRVRKSGRLFCKVPPGGGCSPCTKVLNFLSVPQTFRSLTSFCVISTECKLAPWRTPCTWMRQIPSVVQRNVLHCSECSMGRLQS